MSGLPTSESDHGIRTFFYDDLGEATWKLGGEAWLEKFNFSAKVARRLHPDKTERVSHNNHCVFSVRDAVIYFIKKTEYQYLNKFRKPQRVFKDKTFPFFKKQELYFYFYQ